MHFFLILFLHMACRDHDKLIGDSNVYGRPIEVQFSQGNESNSNGPSSLSARVANGLLAIEHNNLALPCDFEVSDYMEAEWEAELAIIVDYHPEEAQSEEACPVDLKFSLDVLKAGLTPGVYSVRCVQDETEVDLTELLQ